MADQTPSCCDTRLELLTKIVLQWQSMVTGGVPSTLVPFYTDDENDLYRKLLLTFAYL